LLRACLTSAGVRDDIDEAGIEAALVGWRLVSVERVELPSDTRTRRALVVQAEMAGAGLAGPPRSALPWREVRHLQVPGAAPAGSFLLGDFEGKPHRRRVSPLRLWQR